MIVAARFKERGEQAARIGWHAEAFARQERLKDFGSYLRDQAPAKADPDAGARELRLAIARRRERQEARRDHDGLPEERVQGISGR